MTPLYIITFMLSSVHVSFFFSFDLLLCFLSQQFPVLILNIRWAPQPYLLDGSQEMVEMFASTHYLNAVVHSTQQFPQRIQTSSNNCKKELWVNCYNYYHWTNKHCINASCIVAQTQIWQKLISAAIGMQSVDLITQHIFNVHIVGCFAFITQHCFQLLCCTQSKNKKQKQIYCMSGGI